MLVQTIPGFPRTRGDRPLKAELPYITSECGFPRTRGDRPQIGRIHEVRHRGSPARAGIDRQHLAPSSLTMGFPRTRGDRPYMLQTDD